MGIALLVIFLLVMVWVTISFIRKNFTPGE
jgi:Na+-transporting methylmalonyl-CoA/oxaloacetate decarboxylase gamma subunit